MDCFVSRKVSLLPIRDPGTEPAAMMAWAEMKHIHRHTLREEPSALYSGDPMMNANTQGKLGVGPMI